MLVIGAGPAGLAAALAAADSGARVILCDEQSEIGGSLLTDPAATIDGLSAWAWLEQTVHSLAANDRVTVLPRTQAFGSFAQNFVGLAERLTEHIAHPDPERPRERLWQVRAREVVLATGAIERPLVFSGNDRPGIMLADAARSYLNRYGAKPGARAVVPTAANRPMRRPSTCSAPGLKLRLSRIFVRTRARPPWQRHAKPASAWRRRRHCPQPPAASAYVA